MGPRAKLLVVTGLLLSNSFCYGSESILLPKGVKFVEQVDQVANKVVIPYKKFKLENGLTVIVHEDHSDPLVHVDVTYHVGSAREQPGKSGFAHFFEHMMFQGSENVADEQHFKIVTESGGTLNGTTNSDRTNYFETVPKNQLERMLWLESDRMGFLLNAVTQQKFENQRETVKNERGQRVDNSPYGRMGERIAEALYPKDHPYSWPVIGYIEDLNRVNVNDLKAFFLRWYGPNNATLTIGGDVEAAEVLTLVSQYFSGIPKGPAVEPAGKALVSLDKDRYISMEDNVHLPLLNVSFPTVTANHPDEAPLDILASILGGGKTSLLFKNLVKKQEAVEAVAQHPCAELGCQISIIALPHPASGKNLADLKKVIDSTLVEFEKRGVTEDDLQIVKAGMEASLINRLNSVSGKVSQLAAYETFQGNPNQIQAEIDRYSNVTKDDVIRVFKKYIKGKKSVVMSVVPQGQLKMIAGKDNFTPPKRNFDKLSKTDSKSLKFRVASSTFDRSKEPQMRANPAVKIPSFWKQNLENGIKILGAKNEETPTTSLMIKIPAGYWREDIKKAGTANLLASMLSESTKKLSTEELSNELKKLGSSVEVSSSDMYMNVYVDSLTKNLDKTLEIMVEKLFAPGFKDEDFARVKQQEIQGILQNSKNPESLANDNYLKLMYGSTRAGVPATGTVETVDALTLGDIKTFYTDYFKPSEAQLIVVSSLDEKEVFKKIESTLASWSGKSPKLEIPAEVQNKFDPSTIYLVNKDEAAQSVIKIGRLGMKRDFTGNFFKSNLMNFPLGGAFNSRVNLNLREDKGYTYGARSSFWGSKYTGGFTAGASVRADVTDLSIKEFVTEISNYAKTGISDAELDFMKKAINQRDALEYETPRAKMNLLSEILEYDLDSKYIEERSKIVSEISAKEINSLAKDQLDLDKMLKLVVGDKKTLQPKLEAMGYKVIAL